MTAVKLLPELARLRTQVARLEGELTEARERWGRCEEGWNRVILQAEGFQRKNAELAAALDYLRLFRAGLHGLSGKQQVDAVYVQEALDHGLALAANEGQNQKTRCHKVLYKE